MSLPRETCNSSVAQIRTDDSKQVSTCKPVKSPEVRYPRAVSATTDRRTKVRSRALPTSHWLASSRRVLRRVSGSAGRLHSS